VRSPGNRTWLIVVGVSLLAVLAGVAAYAGQARPGGPRLGVPLITGSRDPAQAASTTLRRELRSEHLSVQGVVCIRNGRAYQGHPVIRCNVNFGDPHVEAYCSVILAGWLVTNQQDPSIPCGPDLAGSKPYLFPPSVAGRTQGLQRPVR
jgi:hypothetical protein